MVIIAEKVIKVRLIGAGVVLPMILYEPTCLVKYNVSIASAEAWSVLVSIILGSFQKIIKLTKRVDTGSAKRNGWPRYRCS